MATTKEIMVELLMVLSFLMFASSTTRFGPHASHELLELLADPNVVYNIQGPAPAGASAPQVLYSLEVCDPTQGDSYLMDGTAIAVSNFVTKAYFGVDSSTGMAVTNHLKLDLKPFGVRPLGYVQYNDGIETQQVNGSSVDAGRLAARNMLGDYHRNKRRENRSIKNPDRGSEAAQS